MCTITVERLDCQCQWLLKCLGGMQMMKDFSLKRRLQNRKAAGKKQKKRQKIMEIKIDIKMVLPSHRCYISPFNCQQEFLFFVGQGTHFFIGLISCPFVIHTVDAVTLQKYIEDDHTKEIYRTKQAQEIKETSPPRHFTTGSNPF